MQDDKLRIALEALLDIRKHSITNDHDAYQMRQMATKAIQEIQREHYLGDPSPTVHEVLAGVHS